MSTSDLESMGQRIALLRSAKGWTQAELSRVMKVTRATVMNWENDSVPNIRPPHLMVLAKVLGTDPYYLVYGAARQPKDGWPMVPVK
jgi:transcriptional regulator with XRE-family HTH domain